MCFAGAGPSPLMGPGRDWSTGKMSGFRLRRRLAPFVMAAAVVAWVGVLAGCSAAAPVGPGMMGGAASVATTDPSVPGLGMMSGGGGYTWSRLTCAAPAALPGSTVNVMLGDMGMTRMMGGVAPLGGHMMVRAIPTTVPAGQISFVVSNMGWRTHELVVLPLAAGSDAGQRLPGADGRVDETGSLGEVSASCSAGSGDGISAAAVGWTTMTLQPGRYELLCNLENHYANGMYTELNVS